MALIERPIIRAFSVDSSSLHRIEGNNIGHHSYRYLLIILPAYPPYPGLVTEFSTSNFTESSSAVKYPTTYSSVEANQKAESGFDSASHFTSYLPLSLFWVGTRAMTGWAFGDHHRIVGRLFVIVLISSCGVEGCQASCRTCCSCTSAEASLGGPSKAHIQTTLDRIESTVARRLPSELNVIIVAPRGGPDDSGLMLEAEELEVSM